MKSPSLARWILLPAVLAVSTSAVLIRVASAPPLATAFWRGAFAGLAFLPILLIPQFRRQMLAVPARRYAQIALATTVISLHQICFISSLSFTSVAASTFLTSTQPIFTALLGGVLIRERVSARSWLAIGGAIVGMAVITFSKPVAGAKVSNALLGNALALLAALLASLYTLAARRLRQSVPVVPYMFTVHASGSVFLALIIVVAGVELTGYSSQTWRGLLLLGLIPTLLGHTFLTYAVGHLRAFVVNASILGEPVGATILAALFLSERAGAGTLIGGAIILGCILWIVLEKSDRIPAAPEQA